MQEKIIDFEADNLLTQKKVCEVEARQTFVFEPS
jgi:hypothetical protein